MDAFMMDSSLIKDLSADALDQDGRLKVMPAEFWADTTRAQRGLFGHQHGLYQFPTVELADRLLEIIGDRSAIEIGAGHGVLAEALGIPATDNYQQTIHKYREVYRRARQPIVPYGPNVEKIDATSAVRKHKPKVVIACWVTEKYDPMRPWAGGNEIGVEERRLLDMVDTYVLVGNEQVHRDKTIWKLNPAIEYPDFVYSRAMNGTRDFVAVW